MQRQMRVLRSACAPGPNAASQYDELWGGLEAHPLALHAADACVFQPAGRQPFVKGGAIAWHCGVRGARASATAPPVGLFSTLGSSFLSLAHTATWKRSMGGRLHRRVLSALNLGCLLWETLHIRYNLVMSMVRNAAAPAPSVMWGVESASPSRRQTAAAGPQAEGAGTGWRNYWPGAQGWGCCCRVPALPQPIPVAFSPAACAIGRERADDGSQWRVDAAD
jgi:hypothetical protein